MKKRKVTLYVQSVKCLIGTEKWGRWGYVSGAGIRGGYRLIPDYKTYSKAKYEWVLLDDQKKTVEMVKAIAQKHGFDVEIVDVTKDKKRLRIKTFPTLLMDTGEKIEGTISKEQVEMLFTKT